jgi:hypothetical protein
MKLLLLLMMMMMMVRLDHKTVGHARSSMHFTSSALCPQTKTQ